MESKTNLKSQKIARSLLTLSLLLPLLGCSKSVNLTPEEADERLKDGIYKLSTFDFKNAYNALKPLVDYYDKDSKDPTIEEQWLNSAYGLAASTWHKVPSSLDYIEEAILYYKLIVEKAPTSEIGLQSRIELGRIAEVVDFPNDIQDIETARKYYLEVIELAPNSSFADVATLRLAETYIQHFEDDASEAKGFEILEGYMMQNPQNDMASIMLQYLGDLYFQRKNDIKKSLEYYLKADALGFEKFNARASYWWNIARWAEHLEDYPIAVKYYQRIIRETPRNSRVWLAQNKLRNMRQQFPEMKIEIPRVRMFTLPI